jgi:hypothetical protein
MPVTGEQYSLSGGTSVNGGMTISGNTLTDTFASFGGTNNLVNQRLTVGGGIAWGVIASNTTTSITVSSWTGTPSAGMGYYVAGGTSRPHSYFGRVFDMEIREPMYERDAVDYGLPTGFFGFGTSGSYDSQFGQVLGDNYLWNGYETGQGFASMYVSSFYPIASSWLKPVACVATTNINLSGEQTIDGVTTSTSRVLLTGQTTASQNGLWLSNSGAWTRPTDFGTGATVNNVGVMASGGTANQSIANGYQGWILSATSTITVDTSSQTWTQYQPSRLRVGGAFIPTVTVGTGPTGLIIEGKSLEQGVEKVSIIGSSGTTLTVPGGPGTTTVDITLTGNCTLTLPTPQPGSYITLVLRQDSTGSRTVTWPSTIMQWIAQTAPTLSTAANAIDVVTIFSTDGVNWLSSYGLNF